MLLQSLSFVLSLLTSSSVLLSPSAIFLAVIPPPDGAPGTQHLARHLAPSTCTQHPAQHPAPSTQHPAPVPSLDFDAFRMRVQSIFLNRRKGHARCYACHAQGTPFRLQPLAPGSSSWSEEESRRNFEAVQRVVVPGAPLRSRLLTMPLAAEAGGTDFHPGGKHWDSQDDPEWQLLADWVRGKR